MIFGLSGPAEGIESHVVFELGKLIALDGSLIDATLSMTTRKRTRIPLDELIKEVNETVRGWVEYFHFKNCSHRMFQVRTHLEDRLQTHLRRRYKIRDRGSGYLRFSRRVLYDRHGLFKVPATAGWKRVKALR